MKKLESVLRELYVTFGPTAPAMLLTFLADRRSHAFVGANAAAIKEWCSLRNVI